VARQERAEVVVAPATDVKAAAPAIVVKAAAPASAVKPVMALAMGVRPSSAGYSVSALARQ
jgi:hypothetical protein